MHKLRVGVVRGGPSSGYQSSLKTGATILSHLSPKYQPLDILIDKQGTWHLHGVPREPHEILKHADVIVNAMHGSYGEDGKVQQLLEMFKVPYTGSDAFASSLGMNKPMTKKILKEQGIKTPYHELVDIPGSIEHQAYEIFKSFPLPAVIKPAANNDPLGIRIANDLPELEAALRNAYQFGDKVMIEEFMKGREASCGVVNDFRGKDAYAMLPVEIDGQNAGGVYPGSFSDEEKKIIQHDAKLIHKTLNLRHYSQSNFIVHPRRGVYLLSVSTLPPLAPDSLLNTSLVAIGSSLTEFVEHLIHLAIEKK